MATSEPPTLSLAATEDSQLPWGTALQQDGDGLSEGRHGQARRRRRLSPIAAYSVQCRLGEVGAR